MITAIYDGTCVICEQTRRFVRFFDWRQRVEFLDLHAHEAVRARFPDLREADLMGEIHVIDDAGEVHRGYYGSRRLLKELPLWFPVWLLLRLPGMDAVGVRVYRFIARHRYQINRFFGVDMPDCVDGACKIP